MDIGCIKLANPEFAAYLDKRIPAAKDERPPMPHQLFRKVKFPVSFDSLVLHDGFLTYEEQEGDEPGRIFFDRVSATLTGWGDADRVDVLNLHGTTRIMGKGAAEAWFKLYLNNPRDSFSLRASVDAMDLRDINPMMAKLVPISVHSGSLKRVEINTLEANNSTATGNIDMIYNNLALKLHPTKPGFWHRVEQGFLTELVNLFLPSSNPGDDGKVKSGIILAERDSSRGFFNFVWKSILSGIKSSVGVESKEQKKIRRSKK